MKHRTQTEATSREYSARVNRNLKRTLHRQERHQAAASLHQEVLLAPPSRLNYLITTRNLCGYQGYLIVEGKDAALAAFNEAWCFDGKVSLEEGQFSQEEALPGNLFSVFVSKLNPALLAWAEFDENGDLYTRSN